MDRSKLAVDATMPEFRRLAAEHLGHFQQDLQQNCSKSRSRAHIGSNRQQPKPRQ
jgi:hypothetical protein